ncbi:hypothetical protein WA026_014101 [Henosepilachna vigintioctopunctata]|uniref:Uncharacterized protein n=1 Tax=Henosepilachna vigintioctopunctata TaxID=420089 RepID=A0AAW1TLQ7_9CUCU
MEVSSDQDALVNVKNIHSNAELQSLQKQFDLSLQLHGELRNRIVDQALIISLLQNGELTTVSKHDIKTDKRNIDVNVIKKQETKYQQGNNIDDLHIPNISGISDPTTTTGSSDVRRKQNQGDINLNADLSLTGKNLTENNESERRNASMETTINTGKKNYLMGMSADNYKIEGAPPLTNLYAGRIQGNVQEADMSEFLRIGWPNIEIRCMKLQTKGVNSSFKLTFTQIIKRIF